jgi:hypothetical protein
VEKESGIVTFRENKAGCGFAVRFILPGADRSARHALSPFAQSQLFVYRSALD